MLQWYICALVDLSVNVKTYQPSISGAIVGNELNNPIPSDCAKECQHVAGLIRIKSKQLPTGNPIEQGARGSALQKRGPQQIARWAGSARPTLRIGTRGSDIEAKDETNEASSRPDTRE